jgi:hypothetical protein
VTRDATLACFRQRLGPDGWTRNRGCARLTGSAFRPESPDFNPERYVFDSVVDGHALRLLASGMPMYRVDE